MGNEHLSPLPVLHRVERIMETSSLSSPLEAKLGLPQFELPSGLVDPNLANIAKVAYGSAIGFRTIWDQRVRDQAGTDGDIKPRLRPTTYEMIMTLLTLETLKLLPTDPLAPPTEPARPPFQLDLTFQVDIEEPIQEIEAVLYHFNSPESLLSLFNDLGETIWSNDWLRFFLIRQPHRPPMGTKVFYGVLRWWMCTNEVFITAFLAQKMDPALKAEVDYYIPAARGIRTTKEWDDMWGIAIDDVAKVRRKLDAGVSMAFHAKLSEERDMKLKGTPQSTPRKRTTPRSSLEQELLTEFN